MSLSRYYWRTVKVSNLFVIFPDKHSRDSLCDAVRPHYPTHVWCQSPLCSSLESIYSRQNTEGAAVSRAGHMLLTRARLCLMLVILTATGALSPQSQWQSLIWAMTLSPSPSNTSLTRQLGLCSTGGNRLGDWSRRV